MSLVLKDEVYSAVTPRCVWCLPVELGLIFLGDSNLSVATWVEGETPGCRHNSVIQAESACGPGWHTRGDWMTGGKGGKRKK